MALCRGLLLLGIIACVCMVALTTDSEHIGKEVDHNGHVVHSIERRAIGDCGGIFSEDSGVFSSPNYPGNYDNSEYCDYDISVSPGYVIRLEFSVFHTETNFDKVKIYDTSAYNPTHEYSGSTIPPVFESTGSSMRVVFTSDGSSVYQGFLASYNTAEYVPVEYSLGDCGGVLTTDTGSISSPDYPSEYPHGVDCYYSITVSTGNTVTLEFTVFETESCCDNVEVFDGDSAYASSMGQFSGTSIDSPFVSSGRSLYIRFHSDSSVSDPGFYASYWTTGSGGGGGGGDGTEFSVCDDPVVTTPGGFAQSPNYPLDYPDNRDCILTITATGSFSRVYLRFLDVDLYQGPQGACSDGGDYVTVTDDDDLSMGTVCTSYDIGNEYTSRNSLTLTFHSGEHTDTYKGFQALYSFYYDSSSSNCFYSDDHIYCSSEGRCISGTLECDGYDHCGDGSDEECSNTALIAGVVIGVIALIAIIAVVAIYFCCCKKSSATTPSRGATNTRLTRAPPSGATVGFTGYKPQGINTVSSTVNDPGAPGNNAYGGYYEPTAPYYMNEYNNPGMDLSAGYPPPAATTGAASSYPSPGLPGSTTNDPAYPPPNDPMAMYPPPPQGFGAPAPTTYNPMFPPESNPNMAPPPPSYNDAMTMNRP